ncbi:type II toxin-antitoxin system RelE/ParE family toxin [Natronogracilivirga saccharolytica]|uniref:Type II toxin-antitoxin system RelE/ParE family toxin n=1 Tax=Natronogracilivirga saccharolytica TaxID=2812953 RepID=A0A8J7RPD7_9BACT|nr:type II toxin-antitoxin system RelE/ParE family toxin [Natronogracilivirga saccharolytica]
MLKVYLSPLAEKKLSLLLEFIEQQWAKKERDEFLQKVLNAFKRVATHPESCPKSDTFPNLFKCVVSKQTSFFYRFNSEELEIITVFDNRQDPHKIDSDIKKYFSQ